MLGPKMQRKRLDVVPIPNKHGDAHGLEILTLDGGPLLGHDGEPLGYDSFVLSAPTGDLTIAALGNTSSSLDPLRPSPLDSPAMKQLGGDPLEALAAP